MIDWEPGEIYTATRYLLARWPDGSSLWRYPDKEEDDTSIGEVVLGYFEGDELMDTIELWNIGHDREMVEITQNESVAGEESKVGWFLWTTTPPGWLEGASFEESSRQALMFFPRKLPSAFQALTEGCEVEEESRSLGESLLSRKWETAKVPLIPKIRMTDDEMSRAMALFQKMEKLGMGEAGRSDLMLGFQQPHCLFFWVDGDEEPYVLTFEPHFSNPDAIYVPDTDFRSGRRDGKQAFCVYQANSEYDLLGVGRTIREALLDVVRFVWPGDEAGWATQLRKGEISFSEAEMEIYELLGEFSPCWWASSKFRAWAEASGIEKRPKSSAEKNG